MSREIQYVVRSFIALSKTQDSLGIAEYAHGNGARANLHHRILDDITRFIHRALIAPEMPP